MLSVDDLLNFVTDDLEEIREFMTFSNTYNEELGFVNALIAIRVEHVKSDFES